MRIFKAEIGPLQLDLVIDFGVARGIKEQVGDPMLIAQEAAIAARMAEAGFTHKAKFAFDIENIPLIIWLGAKASDPDLKLSQVQDACIDIGLGAAMGIADSFLAQFIAPRSQAKAKLKAEKAEPAGE
jgi:hypothetical protein